MRLVGKQASAAIIEYEEDGVLRRCLLPKAVVREHGRQIPTEVLHRGIEIGIDVEEAFARMEMPTSTELLNYLRQEGLWTRDDILGNVSRFKLKIAGAIGDQIAEVLMGVRENA